jgi:uncharacterized LabA/DUF88 family protein
MAVSQAEVIAIMAELRTSIETMQANMEMRFKAVVEDARKASEHVIIMVDRSNLDQTWRRIESGPLRPDYIKLKDILIGGRTCHQVRIYYSDIDSELVTDAERPEWRRRQDFYTFLRHQGWVLRGVKKKVYEGIATEKGLDGALIRDMETICRDNRCDTIILVAGDADYCDVVSDVQDRYCVKVEVAFFPNQTARDLQNRATKFVNLECCKADFSRKP